MTDPRMRNLANILVDYSVKVQPGEWVILRGHHIAEPLLNEIAKKVVEAGAFVDTMFESSVITETMLKYASREQLMWESPIIRTAIEKVDVFINIIATDNTKHLSNTDPAQQQAGNLSMAKLMPLYMERESRGDLRWTLTQYPCQAFAQDAEMSLSEYEDFVYAATFADIDDPVSKWLDVREKQEKLVNWLKGKESITVNGPDIDLTLSVKDRLFANCCGEKNMPDGEIFTSPVENSANGWVKFTYPAIEKGKEVEGVRLEFKDGKVVKATAEKNEDFLIKMLDTDDGSRYLGEFAIGTNYGIKKFTKSILYDEKIGGTIHMAVGNGMPELGSKNQSTIHWDMICDMHNDSQILVDGELFYKNGQFQV
ncbi:MAG: aminopeptidase [Anaerolineaceae bacterium]|nr:aminopeptidase [Anaerolineaceae bacterium]